MVSTKHNDIMKKAYYYTMLMLCSLIGFSSCDDDNQMSFDNTGDVDIHTFSINGVEGTINPDNSTISVILPFGTDLKALSPQIKLGDGSVVSPLSGTSVDFVDQNGKLISIEYTVTNNDIYQKYTVSVDVARAKITKFAIGNVQGDIDESTKEIITYLPVGTDITALLPQVEFTKGATITPAMGTAVNFTNPVTYKLEYLGSVFEYTATIILGEKPKQPEVIYNGETIAPNWESIASAIKNKTVNPKRDGINTTTTCVSIERRKEDTDNGGKAWSGGALWNSNKVNIDPAKYSKFTLMVLKNNAGKVQLEIQSDGEANKDWLKADYTAESAGQWQELTFEIPTDRTAIINSILVAPHNDDTANDPNFKTQTIYWDELKVHPK